MVDGYVFQHNNEWELMEISYIDKINPFMDCPKCGLMIFKTDSVCRHCKSKII